MKNKIKTWGIIATAIIAILTTGVFFALSLTGCDDGTNSTTNSGGTTGGGLSAAEREERDRLYAEFLDERVEYSDEGISLGFDPGKDSAWAKPDELEKTFVGYAINLFKGPTYAEAVGQTSLLTWEVLSDTSYGGGNKYIDNSEFGFSDFYAVISDKMSEAFSGLKIDAKVEEKRCKFISF